MSFRESLQELKIAFEMRRPSKEDKNILEVFEVRPFRSKVSLYIGTIYVIALGVGFIELAMKELPGVQANNFFGVFFLGLIGYGLASWSVQLAKSCFSPNIKARIIAGENFVEKKEMMGSIWKYIIWNHVTMIDVHAKAKGRFKFMLYSPGKSLTFLLESKDFEKIKTLALSKVSLEKWSFEAKALVQAAPSLGEKR